MNLEMKVLCWFGSGKVGSSSKAMALTLTGASDRECSYPLDPSDFNRCLLLLEAIPELKPLLPEMGKVSPQWKALVSRWSDIERTFIDEAGFNWEKGQRAKRTYDLMRQVIDAA